MLSTVTLIGRPTKDPELQTTKAGVLYTRLDVAVNKGFGDKEHVNFYTAWIQGETAQRMINAGVKKGSLIYLTGDQDVKTFTKSNGTPGFSININVTEWGYVSSGNAKTNGNSATTQQSPQNTQAPMQNQNAAPQYNPYANATAPQFEEISDDDELPF